MFHFHRARTMCVCFVSFFAIWNIRQNIFGWKTLCQVNIAPKNKNIKKQHHNEAYYQQQQQHKWDERASKRTNEKEIGKMLLSMSPRTTRVFHGFSIDVCMLFFLSHFFFLFFRAIQFRFNAHMVINARRKSSLVIGQSHIVTKNFTLWKCWNSKWQTNIRWTRRADSVIHLTYVQYIRPGFRFVSLMTEKEVR